MIIRLTIKNKLRFVNGDIPRPTGKLLSSWIICNGVITTWILNSLSKETAVSINFSKYVKEIRSDLQERYQRKNHPRVFQIRQELSNLVQNQDSVTTYCAKRKTLLNELVSYLPTCSCRKCTYGGFKDLATYFQT